MVRRYRAPGTTRSYTARRLEMRGELKFLAPSSSRPVFGPSVGGADARSTLRGDYESHEVEIVDARSLDESFSLDVHGFELHKLATVGNLYDETIVAERHDAQCRDLVTAATGASRVHIFDHTWRSDSALLRGEHASREPSSFIHNDYTPWSAVKRVNAIMGDEAATLTSKPFAIVNVWRPITTVESWPLAVCDSRTLSEESLVAAERRGKGRVGEIYLVRFDASQRWLFFSALRPDEVVLIKTFDSRMDGRARWCVHTSFDEPNGGSTRAPRESMETRLFAFFD